jgi:SAM-dependent methyltransferase
MTTILASLRAGRKCVLDLGIENGLVVDTLQRRFPNSVVGVESSRPKADYAKTALDLDAAHSDLNVSHFPSAGRDVATASEVTEHVFDPLDLAKQLRRCLRSRGRILVGMDNFGFKIAGFLGPRFRKWVPHCHLSHFSTESLQRSPDPAGFRSQPTSAFFPWEFVLRSLLHKMAPPRAAATNSYTVAKELAGEKGAPYRLHTLRNYSDPW